ncbi:hypothetical protein MTR_2g043870 [Medicago truncatula]|uniref:Endonuclease/exonuclease/phosphatase family protein n=1 Tax=Medicago truncatula TaxID=3880 RepID=A0A072V8E3_MEDTR|nr:hypothetical protein MTR_2g043870 [Medicago truncatula]
MKKEVKEEKEKELVKKEVVNIKYGQARGAMEKLHTRIPHSTKVQESKRVTLLVTISDVLDRKFQGDISLIAIVIRSKGWNCRGLGNPSIVPKLKYILRYHKPAALFLNETLVHSNKANEFRYMLGFDNRFVVSSIGRSGGLALFWQNSFNCTVLNYSNNHINVEVNDSSRGH